MLKVKAQTPLPGKENCPRVSELTIDTHLRGVLHQYNMTQHFKVATHLMGNILDLIITSPGDLQVSNVQSRDVGLTDHLQPLSCYLLRSAYSLSEYWIIWIHFSSAKISHGLQSV